MLARKFAVVLGDVTNVAVARAMSISNLDEATIDNMGTVLSVSVGMPQAELDAMPIRGGELAPAFTAITILAGLGQAEGAPAGDGNSRKDQP